MNVHFLTRLFFVTSSRMAAFSFCSERSTFLKCLSISEWITRFAMQIAVPCVSWTVSRDRRIPKDPRIVDYRAQCIRDAIVPSRYLDGSVRKPNFPISKNTKCLLKNIDPPFPILKITPFIVNQRAILIFVDSADCSTSEANELRAQSLLSKREASVCKSSWTMEVLICDWIGRL